MAGRRSMIDSSVMIVVRSWEIISHEKRTTENGTNKQGVRSSNDDE